jgi:large subunit ribosomal protein L4
MPLNTKIYDKEAKTVGDIDLSSRIFGLKANMALIHQVFVAQTANERQVIAHTKGRADVRGGGKKPWRQKGTGRARAGSSRSPIWIGGGVTFGPTKDRNFKKKINKKMKSAALLMVISDRLGSGSLAILEKLEIKEYKTKLFNSILSNFEETVFKKIEQPESGEKAKPAKYKRSILLVSDSTDEMVKYSARNLAGAKLLFINNLNIVDLLKYRQVIMTKDAAAMLQERYSK